MSEQELDKQELMAFKEKFNVWFDDALSFLMVEPDKPISIDPHSMDESINEDSFEGIYEGLTDAEKALVEKLLYEKLGLDPNNLDAMKVRDYKINSLDDTPSPGEVDVSVYKTNLKEPDLGEVFLQILTFQDDATRFVIGPDQDI